ncbi:MAG: DUF4351 domain-containing protein [Chamaesiphon sp.]|nr:DUF4351 domain-containing protein [Chamaesiphon sp.]
MTRFPHDQFAKDCLESLLSPLGQVQTSLKISGEVREMDVYFTPDPSLSPAADLGLLGQCASTPAVFEPYRNSVKVPQIRACISKLYDLHSQLIREAKRNHQPEPGEDTLPMLWILTPTLSASILANFGAKLDLENWGEGVYLLPPALKTGTIVIHQLPKTPETIWFRLLGKERVQARAIDEVRAFPDDNPYRNNALELLGNLRVILEARETIEPDEQELIMQLSPLYLEKIQAAERVGEARGKAEGEAGLIVRQLTRRFGSIEVEVSERIQQLSIAQLDDLGEALLDFTSLADLAGWLARN